MISHTLWDGSGSLRPLSLSPTPPPLACHSSRGRAVDPPPTVSAGILRASSVATMIPHNQAHHFPYGFATFNLSEGWGVSAGAPADYNRAYGHLGATYGYQSIVLYFPAADLRCARTRGTALLRSGGLRAWLRGGVAARLQGWLAWVRGCLPAGGRGGRPAAPHAPPRQPPAYPSLEGYRGLRPHSRERPKEGVEEGVEEGIWAAPTTEMAPSLGACVAQLGGRFQY